MMLEREKESRLIVKGTVCDTNEMRSNESYQKCL